MRNKEEPIPPTLNCLTLQRLEMVPHLETILTTTLYESVCTTYRYRTGRWPRSDGGRASRPRCWGDIASETSDSRRLDWHRTTYIDSFYPTKLDHFALLLALQIIFPLVRFLQICDVLIILWLASWKALICLNVKLVTILSKIVRALFHTTELRGNKWVSELQEWIL